MLKFVSAIILVATVTNCCLSIKADGHQQQSWQQNMQDLDPQAPPMSTNVALVGNKEAYDMLQSKNGLVIEPSKILDESNYVIVDNDIEEDPNDPFITSPSGKRRATLVREAQQWAGEAPTSVLQKTPSNSGTDQALRRVKRCGGGDGDGGGGGGARRARRRRARRARRARAQANARRTTTVTRKVVQNGQVVSQTSETIGQNQALHQSGQPTVVTHNNQPPVVQTVAAPVPQQPVVIQQQPAVQPQVVQPQVIQPQANQQQQPVAQVLPSISVQGSVKVN